MECQVIADDAQADLAVAMPALEKAMAEVDKLDKTSITEVRPLTLGTKLSKPEVSLRNAERSRETALAPSCRSCYRVHGMVMTTPPNISRQVKAYSKPPPLVETVMAAVMTMMGRGSDWATAKKALGEGNFLTQVCVDKKDGIDCCVCRSVAENGTTLDKKDKTISGYRCVCAASRSLTFADYLVFCA